MSKNCDLITIKYYQTKTDLLFCSVAGKNIGQKINPSQLRTPTIFNIITKCLYQFRIKLCFPIINFSLPQENTRTELLSSNSPNKFLVFTFTVLSSSKEYWLF